MSASSNSYSVTPSPDDVRLAAASFRAISNLQNLAEGAPLEIRITVDKENLQAVSLPASAVKLISGILQEMSQGKTVSCMSSETELTTQQAADLLSVSRPFLIERLDKGEIPFHKVGSHRRMLFADIIGYKRKIDELRLQTLHELTAQAQELDMGY